METKFYNFSQNNSGGYFVEDLEKGVCEEIIIEAVDSMKAFEKLNEIGKNVSGFHNYCDCCGERWSCLVDDSDGKEKPEIYGVDVNELKAEMFRNQCSIHYIDGTIKNIIFPEKTTR